jgi:hypothetical protein
MLIVSSKPLTYSPDLIWSYWLKMRGPLKEGDQGIFRGIKYLVTKVSKNEVFTLRWKSFLTKIFMTYKIEQSGEISKISLEVKFKGIFSWALESILKRQLTAQLENLLEEMVQGLESQSGV